MTREYKSILKATSIFGGTQVVQIIVGLMKSKFVAILIGTTGMGMSSMYLSSLTMIATIFGLGLHSSVIRELSKAHDNNDMEKFFVITTIFRRLLYFMSILGTLCVVLLSNHLSKWAFDTTDRSLDYCFLSLIVCFTLLTQGNTAVLISSRRIKDVALCTLIGSVVSLLTSIPMFYVWGLNGIVPGLIVSVIANYIVTYFFVHRIRIQKCSISSVVFKKYAKVMIGLGVAMIIASLLGNVSLFLINVAVARMGGLSDLGLFNAGISITTQAITLIFAAMGADYYPRLVAAMSNVVRMNETINQQSEIVLYLSTPILAIFMLMAPLIISILLSPEFNIISGFIRILCFGMLFKVSAYALGYVSFAKGDKLVYLFLEGGYTNFANLVLSVSMYYIWGLTGLAYSFVLNYVLYIIILSIVVKKKYRFSVSRDVLSTFGISFLSMLLLLCLTYVFSGFYYYLIGSLLCSLIMVYNVLKINQKTKLIEGLKVKLSSKFKYFFV